jgi:hypothetical protein
VVVVVVVRGPGLLAGASLPTLPLLRTSSGVLLRCCQLRPDRCMHLDRWHADAVQGGHLHAVVEVTTGSSAVPWKFRIDRWRRRRRFTLQKQDGLTQLFPALGVVVTRQRSASAAHLRGPRPSVLLSCPVLSCRDACRHEPAAPRSVISRENSTGLPFPWRVCLLEG